MTREEAASVLADYDISYDGHTAEEVVDAFDVAIAALKAEPCKDTISREAVLEEIEQWVDNGECFFRDANFLLYARIKGLPYVEPIRPRGHWIESEGGIACSECGNEENSESYYCPWCGADMREDSDV